VERVIVYILIASLSFQFPDFEGLGTGFFILNLILGFSDFTTALIALMSSRFSDSSDAAAEGAVVHQYCWGRGAQ